MRVALGTLVAIEATHEALVGAEEAVAAAHGMIASISRLLHPQDEASELARIRVSVLDTPVAIHGITRDLLVFARHLHALTLGVFDPCLPTSEGRLADLEIVDDGSAPCVVCRKPVALDFGGFAKGFVVDRAIDTLRAGGCNTGLVNAGGDVRVFGAREYAVLLRSPDRDYAELALSEGALAVSDLDAANRPSEHQGYYVREGALSLQARYAAVRANTAMVADALTKCALLCPTVVSTEVLRSFNAECVSISSYPASSRTPAEK